MEDCVDGCACNDAPATVNMQFMGIMIHVNCQRRIGEEGGGCLELGCPPEQTRDYVLRASKSLMKGDWKECVELCCNLEVWNLVAGEGSAQAIQDMLAAKIKLEGLRTYLFAFSAQYDSLSLSQLCGMFEMSKNEVHSVVSKMMINRELYASWDQPTETIVLGKVEPNGLQALALQVAEKTANLVEANAPLLDAFSGSHGYRDDSKGNDGGDYRGGYNNKDNFRRGGNSGFQSRDGSGRGVGSEK